MSCRTQGAARRTLLLLCFMAVRPLVAGEAAPPVFPGAKGFGVRTPAGRGGAILRVTNLERDGAGSLRAAVEAKGPRFILFEVSGVIDLGGQEVAIREPFVTLAGQTAPAPGITLIGGRITVATHDVWLQHIRVRAGDKYGGEPDCLSVGDYQGRAEVFNVVVDHCTFTWSVDECASISGSEPFPHDITFSSCIIAQALSHATHSKGEHSKGTLIHNNSKRVALIGNLYAHNFRRNPYVKEGTTTFIANNVIYNPGELGLHLSRFGGSEVASSVIGNVFLKGPNTPPGLSLISSMGGGISVYAADNLALDEKNQEYPILTRGGTGEVRKWNAGCRLVKEPAVTLPEFAPKPAAEVVEHVLATAGAFPGMRDALDAKLVDEVRKREGRIIDSPKEVGGYPEVPKTERKLRDFEDPHGDADGDGYTNIEELLQRAAALVEGRM